MKPSALCLVALLQLPSLAAAQWPQGPGPDGNWAAEGDAPPLRFSVRTGENVLWRAPLPETGQGGIAVHSGRLFVACMRPWDPAQALSVADAERYAHAIEKRAVAGKDILALCLDADTGEPVWTRSMHGEVPAIYTYPFSDATSPSPVTDGEHVWFTNACGLVTCFSVEGQRVWERRFTPTFDGPFNKQFEPFLVTDRSMSPARQVFVHMEPFPAPNATDPERLAGRWHALVGLDAATGELLWRSEDGLTHYNAPTLVETPEGTAILHARGGPHEVPERPVGVSLTRLTGEQAGRALWRYEDPRGNHEGALQTMAYDGQYVYWLLKAPHSVLVLLDRTTGKPVKELSLQKSVTLRSFDSSTGSWQTQVGVDLEKPVMPARYSMIAAGGDVYFQTYATAWGKPTLGAPYSIARANLERGHLEYLEVPTDVVREPGEVESFLWRMPRSARPLNSRGIEVTGDDRSRWGGWDWVFNGSPTRVNDSLYFTLASGVVYVIDAGAEGFDARALLAVNDLGPVDGVWTANSVSYSDGRLYHRTGAELVCVGRPVPNAPASDGR